MMVLQNLPLIFFFIVILFLSQISSGLTNEDDDVDVMGRRFIVKREERETIVETEYGGISAVKINDGIRGPYYLQFITLEPNSLFLPVLLHAEMVFYVPTGSGRLSWVDVDGDDLRTMNIRKGDVYRLRSGSVFFVESNLETEREKLRIHSIFSNTDENLFEPLVGAYSSINDLVLGFDKEVLKRAFQVTEDVIESVTNATKPPAMVHALPRKKTNFWVSEARFLKSFASGGGTLHAINGKKKRTKTYNLLDADPDFSNCNGWSLTVDKSHLRLLRDSNIGIFMVNLTKGSMMGPHWNPVATEIAIVVQGQGMVRVVCPRIAKKSECKNMRFRVEEGDVFAVPRFHPMAQISFNNDTFVFMGFSTTLKRNYPQFLAGKSSVFQVLDKQILALSFNVSNSTIERFLAPQAESFILDCTSCAEEEEMIMEEEIRKEREEEEARKREEEEARKREEEEERKREEEEAKKREEEEARKREEEEEARKREEEARKREEEEEARKREEEETRKREEEEEARKREEEEERKREEEEARKREEEEEEERKREEEEARRREEEEAIKKKEEEARRREEEEARKQEEEEARRREEQEREREEREERQEEQETREREQEEERRQEEEQQRQEEAEREQEAARRKEKERQRREREQEEKQRQREEEEKEEETGGHETEEERARRQEKERQKRREEEEDEEPMIREKVQGEDGRRAPMVTKNMWKP